MLGFSVGAAFLFLAFRRIEMRVLVRKLSDFNFWWLPLFAVSHLTGLYVRSLRWQSIVNPIERVRLKILFPITVRGFLISNIIPMKAGDLYRFYALSKSTELTKATSLATLIVERLADLVGLVLLSWALMLVLPLPQSLHRAVLWTGLALGVAMLIWWIVRRSPGFNNRLKRGELRLANWAESSRIGRIIGSLKLGFNILRDSRQWVTLLVLTGLIFVFYSLGTMSVLWGFGLKEVSLLAPFVLLTIVFWTSVLPQPPAGVGTFEYASLLALQLFGIGKEEALASALFLHAAVIVNLMLISGLTYLIPGLPKIGSVRGLAADPSLDAERPNL